MKPFIYKIKDTEVYFTNDSFKNLGITSNKSEATIYRSKKNFATYMDKDNTILMLVHRHDTALIDNLKKKGYHISGGGVKIPIEDITTEEVADTSMTPSTITGDYVIKIKNLNLYLRPSTDRETMLTTDKSEAAVFHNPKSDIIGKMERGMDPAGAGKTTGKPFKKIFIWSPSKRGNKVCLYILNDEEAKKVFQELPESGKFATGKAYDEIQYAWTHEMGFFLELPVEYWEREKI